MTTGDTRAILDLLTTWQRAVMGGDLEALRPLLAEDVVFLRPGAPPIRGRDEFMALQEGMRGKQRITLQFECEELVVHGDWAHCRNRLTVTVTPLTGATPERRAGHTLSIFRKQADGRWVLKRDANLLAAEPPR